MLYIPQSLKCCSRCQTYLPLYDFHIDKNGRYGRVAKCKRCLSNDRGVKPRELLPEGYKRCQKCNILMPISSFHHAKDGIYNRRGSCKDCLRSARGYKARERYPDGFRRCGKCKRLLPISVFYKRPNNRYHSRCKACHAVEKGHSAFTDNDWTVALDYWKCRCAYCGRPQGLWHKLSREHFIPRIDGGDYTPSNIIPACFGKYGCNNSKGKRNVKTWLVSRFGELEAKRLIKRIEDYFAWLETQDKRSP